MRCKRIRTAICKLLLPVFFPGLFLSVSGQTAVIDSLRQVIANQSDSRDKADNVIKLSRFLFLRGNYDSVIFLADSARSISEHKHYPAGVADSYYMKSSALKMKGDFKQALECVDGYLEIYNQMKDSLRLARGCFNMGTLYKELEEYDLSIIYCQKSLSYAIPVREQSLILGNYNCLGSVYVNSSAQYDSAALYFLKALDLIEKSGNMTFYTTVLNNIADVYINDKQYELARAFLNKCIDMNLQENRLDRLATNYINVGRVAIMENKPDEALEMYNKALEIYTGLDDQRGIADVNNNLGDFYFKSGQYEKAYQYFDLALAYYRQKSLIRGIVLTTLNKAAIVSERGNTALAKMMQDSVIDLASQNGNVSLLIMAYRNIADNYNKSGDYKNAYQYRLQYEYLSDSVFNLEKSKAINALQLKYEKGKSEARILELEKENLKKTNQKNAYMFTGIGVIVITLFIVAYFRQKSRHDRIVSEQKILQLEEEKKLIAARLLVEGQEEERKRIATELHDGIGVLLSATRMQFSVIGEKSPENKEIIDKASKMLEQASGDVRKISHNMMPGLLTKLGFLEAAQDLLERISDGGEIQAVCEINGDQEERLPENKEIMLYRIIQEMVNNTLKHAKAKNISLIINLQPGIIDILYADDGVGFNFDQKIENESLGLKSIQSRVNFLSGTLNVESSPGHGAKFMIQLPV